MENELYITVYHKETIDASKLNLGDENKNSFWSHLGNTAENKKNLEKYCKTAEYLLNKIKRQNIDLSDLSEKELEAYNIFFKKPPIISYSPYSNDLVVTDGRHRLAMCKELDIKLDYDVRYDMKFMIYKVHEPIKNDDLVNRIRDFLFREKGMNEEYFKEDEKYKYIAVHNGGAENKILQDIGCGVELFGEANSETFVIVPYKKVTLDRLIDYYKQENVNSDILLSKDTLKYMEETR